MRIERSKVEFSVNIIFRVNAQFKLKKITHTHTILTNFLDYSIK